MTARGISPLPHLHTAYFADSGQAEAVHFCSSRRKHRATEVQLSVDAISDWKLAGLLRRFTADKNCFDDGLVMAEEHLHSRSLCYSWCNMYSQQPRLCSCVVSACICSAHPSCDPAVFLTSFYAQWVLFPHVRSGGLSAVFLLWRVTEFINQAWAGRWCWYCIISPQ